MAKTRLILPCLILFLLSFAFLPAQEATPASGTSEGGPITAQVTIDGLALFSVEGIKSYPAQERAKTIAQRIRKIAADPKIRIDSLATVDSPDYAEIAAGDFRIMRVYDLDSGIEMEGLPRQVLAGLYLEKIKRAVERYRLDRARERLVRSGITAAGATMGFAVTLLLFLWLFKKLMSLIESKTKSRIISLQAKSRDLVKAERLGKMLTDTLRTIRFIIVFALVLAYLTFVLGLFPWTRALSGNLADYFFNPLRKTGRAILDYVPNIIFIIVIILVVRYILRLIRTFFQGVERQTITIRSFEPEWAMPTYKIARVLVIALCAVIIYPYVPGTGSLAFKGLSVFAGLLISLGASSAISNIIAGYTMTYRRAFRVGDRVKIGDYLGDVTAMRLLVTHLKSPKNEEIVVPNSLILNSHIVNYSSLAREQGLILHTSVTIGYDTPWRQVNALLLMAAEKTPGILREPKPFVFQKSLTDFYIEYELNAFTNSPLTMMQAYSELHKNILDAFNEYGVQITSPNYESDPDNLKIVPREKWFAAPAKPQATPPAEEKE